MNKYITFIGLLSMMFFVACGGGESGSSESEDQAVDESASMAGMKELSLVEHGMDISIMVPDENTGIAEVIATDWSVEIRVGEGFMISVSIGEGDLALLKSDLEEDLVYKSEILEETESYIVYKREIENSGMEPEHHFFYIADIDGDQYDVQNLKDVTYSKEAIDRMLASAKSIKAVPES